LVLRRIDDDSAALDIRPADDKRFTGEDPDLILYNLYHVSLRLGAPSSRYDFPQVTPKCHTTRPSPGDPIKEA